MDFCFKEHYDIADLVTIMRLLRAPDGCPWDRVQDHHSIRQNFIEETYEAVEAIDNDDTALLREELGDVLMQVVFHSVMEEEVGGFTFDDVCDEVCQKLIIRHPHVFADVSADTPEQVLRNWDAIKMQTHEQTLFSDAVDSVAKSLPALMRAQKVQKRAAKSGFDIESRDIAFDKVREEYTELAEVPADDKDRLEDELGDLLFSVVNIARFSGVDAEQALTRATDKYAARFRKVEELCIERGIDMQNTPIPVIDSLWEDIK